MGGCGDDDGTPDGTPTDGGSEGTGTGEGTDADTTGSGPGGSSDASTGSSGETQGGSSGTGTDGGDEPLDADPDTLTGLAYYVEVRDGMASEPALIHPEPAEGERAMALFASGPDAAFAVVHMWQDGEPRAYWSDTTSSPPGPPMRLDGPPVDEAEAFAKLSFAHGWILFGTATDGQSTLWRASAEAGVPGEPESVFSTPAAGLGTTSALAVPHPDGRRVVMTADPDGDGVEDLYLFDPADPDPIAVTAHT